MFLWSHFFKISTSSIAFSFEFSIFFIATIGWLLKKFMECGVLIFHTDPKLPCPSFDISWKSLHVCWHLGVYKLSLLKSNLFQNWHQHDFIIKFSTNIWILLIPSMNLDNAYGLLKLNILEFKCKHFPIQFLAMEENWIFVLVLVLK